MKLEGREQIIEYLTSVTPYSAEELSQYSTIGHGDVHINMRRGNDEVLHATLPLILSTESEIMIANRWIYPSKGRQIKALYDSLPVSHGIRTPSVTAEGDQVYQGIPVSYWAETYLHGQTLTEASFDGLGYGTYSQLTLWLAEFHHGHENTTPLREYFATRFHHLKEFFSSLEGDTHIDAADLQRIEEIIAYGESILNIAVNDTEVASTIHGDLRHQNLLLDNGSIGIIDFEQGINGGDWYADIEKLLMLSSNQLPDPTRPDRYRPPLSPEQKLALVDAYISAREALGWASADFARTLLHSPNLLQARINIFNIDNTLSSFVFGLIRGRASDESFNDTVGESIRSEVPRLQQQVRR